MTREQYEVLSPIGDDAIEQAPPARRVDDLNGKTVALLSNNQFRADRVLACVADEVRRRYPDAKVISWENFPQVSAMGDVEKSVRGVTAALRELRPDAVVSATGA